MDKRRKEIIFLAAGLVVLLAALYFTFRPSAPAAQAVTQPPPVAVSAPPAPKGTIEVAAVPLPMSEGNTTDGRNPFRPVIAAARAVAPISAPPAMTAMMPPSLPPLTPLPFAPFREPGAEISAPPALAAPPPPPAEPKLALTGIIYGDPSIAIIRKGDKRYFVRPGDPVDSRYVVQSISHRRVVLASSQETLSLDLTGRL